MNARRIISTGAAAAAVLLAAAPAAASASPTWHECAKAAGGRYSDNSCTTEGSGKSAKYEIEPGVGKGKAAKGSASEFTWLMTNHFAISVAPPQIETRCKGLKATTMASSPDGESDIVLTMRGCKMLGSPCQSGSEPGVIETNELAGTLGDIEKGSRVGIELHAAAGPGSPLVTYSCTEIATITWVGSAIGEQTGDVGTFSRSFGERFTLAPELGEVEYEERGSKYRYNPLVNSPTSFEGEAPRSHYLTAEAKEVGSEETTTYPGGILATASFKGEDLEIGG